MHLPRNAATTRRSLHMVAEHVLAAARYRAVGRIGLEVATLGIATPPFAGTVLRTDGTDLVVERAGQERRGRLTTLRAAGELAGIEPGLPPGTYTPVTPLDPDGPLELDLDAVVALTGWLAWGHAALVRFAGEIAADDPTPETLWPEHLDLALSAAEVNYGVSLGDDATPEPYAYVGPWARPLPGDPARWDQPFGATLDHTQAAGIDDLVAFFHAGRQAARAG